MELSLLVATLVVAAGVAVGALSALLGVGGGLVMVPFMVLALERSQHLAEGTSLLVIIPTAVAAVMAHNKKGYVSFRHAAFMALGGTASAFFGAALALQLAPEVLQKAFGGFIFLMGARMVWQGTKTTRGRRGPEEIEVT